MKKSIVNGQIGLVLLVIMGIVVALVMSVASRSFSDTVLSRQEKENSAAFSVAESGIEQALSAINQGSIPSGSTTFSDSTSLVTGNYMVTTSPDYGLYVREGESAHLDVEGFVGSLNLSIFWTKKADATENITTPCTEGSGTAPAAIEISAIKATSVTRTYYNPFSCSPSAPGFLASANGGTTYLSKVDPYAVPAGTTAIRIKPIYSGATIAVTGAPNGQLYLIQSKATGGDASKEIEVRRGLDAPAAIFDFAVFSASTIVK